MGNGIALYLPNLGGGGAQRVMVNLAGGMSRRGLEVDLVVAGASGPLLADVPAGANLVDLGSRGVLASLPRLASLTGMTMAPAATSGSPRAEHQSCAAMAWADRS